MYEHGLISPVVALVVWTLIIWIWMYATRIPAMNRAKINPQDAQHPGSLDTLPSSARRVADNYNHLMEQPTIFYAICFALQFMDQTHPINIGLAWSYVLLRVVHSLVQCTVNIVTVRFLLFVLSTLVLFALTFHAAIASGLAWFNVPSLPH
jgi:hypothetical protein